MLWLDRYLNFINSCDSTNEYLENHHILPKADDCFPEFSNLKKFRWNSKLLSAREHYIAHYMLSKLFSGSQIFAFCAMNNKNSSKNTHRINSRLYEDAKFRSNELIAKINSGKVYNNGIFNVKFHDGDKIPDGYVRGSIFSRFTIYNVNTGEHKSVTVNKNIKESFILEDGWKIGNTEHSKRMTGKRVVYNKITGETKRVDSSFDIGSDWCFGSPNTKSCKDKKAINRNGDIKYIDKNEKIPDGWNIGTNVKLNKGKTCYKDKEGNKFHLKTDDPLIKELGLKGIMYSDKTIKCDHCGKEGYPAGMKKHHFNNCKFK